MVSMLAPIQTLTPSSSRVIGASNPTTPRRNAHNATKGFHHATRTTCIAQAAVVGVAGVVGLVMGVGGVNVIAHISCCSTPGPAHPKLMIQKLLSTILGL